MVAVVANDAPEDGVAEFCIHMDGIGVGEAYEEVDKVGGRERGREVLACFHKLAGESNLAMSGGYRESGNVAVVVQAPPFNFTEQITHQGGIRVREADADIRPIDEVLLVERDGIRLCPVIEVYFIEIQNIRRFKALYRRH